jgi:hypothetical protein
VPSATTTRTAERALLLAAVLAAAVLALAGRATPSVVVRDPGGVVVARAPLPSDGRFALSYRHSVYGAPAVEQFVVGPGDTFRLVGISSPSEAVLDYYALDGSRRRDGDGWRLDVAGGPGMDSLPVIATALGERTLVAGGLRLPLFAPAGARHLTLDLES